jgi:hypothetical protein
MDVLTRIEQRGTYVKIAPDTVDSRALANHLLALRVAGHAIVAEETFDSSHKSLGVTVTHYLNCNKCPR